MATKEEADKTQAERSFADWMSTLPDTLLDVPLHKLAIPGSHNSGAYDMKKEWGIGKDADQSVKNLGSLPLIGAMARDIILRYSLCQNLPIYKQLEAGVRYLDMRVALHQPSEELYIIHSLFGPTVAKCMEDVKEFLNKHKKEVVLIDFNHFYDMDLEHHLQLITYLISVFDGMLCPCSSLADLTLRSLWAKGTRIIVFYHHSSIMEFDDFWRPSSIHSFWPSTMDADECLARMEQSARERKPNQFLVCQAVLTPCSSTIMQHPLGSLLDSCSRKINSKCLEWMEKDSLKACRGAIYSVDFIDDCDFVNSVVAMCKRCGE